MTNKVNILGTEYEITFDADGNSCPILVEEGYGGVINNATKRIAIGSKEHLGVDDEEFKVVQPRIIAHEVVHAYLYESGLNENSDWATNEEIVDWIALQLPKIVNSLKDLGVM